MSRIIVEMIGMTEQVTRLGISRWSDLGGSYRSMPRLYATVVSWAKILSKVKGFSNMDKLNNFFTLNHCIFK